MRTLVILIGCLVTFVSISSAQEVEWPDHMPVLFAQAKKSIPSVREFYALFPEATVEVYSRLDGAYLGLQVGLYQRYLVTLDIPITPNRHGEPIKSWGVPNIQIFESGKITVDADDKGFRMGSEPKPSPETEFKRDWASQRELSPEMFQTLYEHHGDFNAVGIDLIRHDPVENFDRLWTPPSVKYVLRRFTISPSKSTGCNW